MKKDEFDTDSSDDEWNDPDPDLEKKEEQFPDFAQFDELVRHHLSTTLSNKAFIKLNWSAPRDAFWSLNKTFCETLSDVYILLKSSDFITHDLNEAFSECTDRNESSALVDGFKYTLVMREWVDLNPMMEFRCFVRDNKLIG